MNRLKSGLAAFGLVAATVCINAGSASAATVVTLTGSGTVQGLITGFPPNWLPADVVDGAPGNFQLTFTLPDTPTTGAGSAVYSGTAVTHIGLGPGDELQQDYTGPASISMTHNGGGTEFDFSAAYSADAGVNATLREWYGDPGAPDPTSPPLLLSQIPNSWGNMLTYLGGLNSLFVIHPTDGAELDLFADNWSLTVTKTPIPATLPLFLSALAGLGFFGWRRGRGTA